jgi:hypothetical protein
LHLRDVFVERARRGERGRELGRVRVEPSAQLGSERGSIHGCQAGEWKRDIRLAENSIPPYRNGIIERRPAAQTRARPPEGDTWTGTKNGC